MSAVLPPPDPIIGDVVRLDLLTADDLPALAPILIDERVYADGYVMHRRPLTLEDGAAVAAERFLAGQGTADGHGGGRTAYAVRLVTDQTDVLNTRSAGAIAKLGAVREGVHRRHTRREDGTFRDTVVFAVTIDDWPSMRDRLLARLGRA